MEMAKDWAKTQNKIAHGRSKNNRKAEPMSKDVELR